MLREEAHGPLAAEGHEVVILEVLEDLGARAELDLPGITAAGGDAPQVLVGQAAHAKLHAVLRAHPVLKDIELQGAHDAHDDLL